MKITKGFDNLKQIENGDYILEGNLISTETIEITLDDRLVVRGKIETTKSIIVNCGIKAGEGIEAGYGIKAGEGIEAGYGIKAGTFIYCEKRIFAGTSIYHTSVNCIKTIKCEELRKGEICFGELIITKKEETKFKVGQLVQIKSWDEMAKEFGTDYYGDINCCCMFPRSMQDLCGKYAEIKKLDGKYAKLHVFNYDETRFWQYSTDMIKPIKED